MHRRSPAAGRIPTSFLVAHSHPPAGPSKAAKNRVLKKGILTGESRFFVWIMRGEFLIIAVHQEGNTLNKFMVLCSFRRRRIRLKELKWIA